VYFLPDFKDKNEEDIVTMTLSDEPNFVQDIFNKL